MTTTPFPNLAPAGAREMVSAALRRSYPRPEAEART